MNTISFTYYELFNLIVFTFGMTLLVVFLLCMWYNGYLNNCLKESVEEIKKAWPFYLLLALFGVVIPTTLAIIFG